MISFVRVDNRLIHGQVVEAWLPQLKVARVVVADNEAAESPLIRAAMGLAVEGTFEVIIDTMEHVNFTSLAEDAVKTLVLFRDLEQVMAAKSRGLPLSRLNLGNVHYATGRRQVSPSVFLSPAEMEELEKLSGDGTEVEARGVPTDRPAGMAELRERFGRGT